MRKVLLGVVLGIAVAATASAFGLSGGQSVELEPGDSAYVTGAAPSGQPTCQAILKRGAPTLSCFVDSAGGELRKRFGVTISSDEVTVSRYLGPSAAKPYRVIFRRDQRNGFIAH